MMRQMNNMKKLLVRILFVLFGTQVIAGEYTFDPYYDDSFSIKDKKVVVAIYDEARGGCWTNIGEAKRYAEDKLMLKGAKIVNDMANAQLVLNISVKTFPYLEQLPSNCIGTLELALEKGVRSKGNKWKATMSEHKVQFLYYKPMNDVVLEELQKHLGTYY